MSTLSRAEGARPPPPSPGVRKAYWNDHKDVYDGHVRGPMQALLAELEAEFGAGKIFRPYRDIRFSQDKSRTRPHAAQRWVRSTCSSATTWGRASRRGAVPDRLV